MVLSELLAPAGSYDVLVIAVNAGADAVYIAGQQYGARAFAKNFTMEEIEKAVEYAHLNGVKVHVTVNTLINNFEIADVMNYLFKLYQIGIDAVIVQDFGICWLLKTLIPDLEVHGSTQMALSNYSSIKWAAKNNIKRVVLPREINVKEIAKTHEQLKKTISIWKLKYSDMELYAIVFPGTVICLHTTADAAETGAHVHSHADGNTV